MNFRGEMFFFNIFFELQKRRFKEMSNNYIKLDVKIKISIKYKQNKTSKNIK